MLAARTNGRRRERPHQSCTIEHNEHHPLTFPLLRSGDDPFDRSAIEPFGACREAPGRVVPLPRRSAGEGLGVAGRTCESPGRIGPYWEG